MRRVLFDENLPRQLRRDLPEFEIRTVQQEGWGTFKNGDLLRRAERRFDVLVMADRRMQYQQRLATFSIRRRRNHHATVALAGTSHSR